MIRSHAFLCGTAVLALAAGTDRATSAPRHLEVVTEAIELDAVGPAAGVGPLSKVLHDTLWIADWTFDAGGGLCTDAGWTTQDRYLRLDDNVYWVVDDRFSGTGGIVGKAAVLSKHDLSWARDGYGNDWDYSIVLEYRGASTLSFSYLSDSEPGFDFVQVEIDSAGASESRVDVTVDPFASSVGFRVVLLSVYGVQQATVGPIPLSDFGVPATTHEAYIRFSADGAYSDEDGLYSTLWNAALVVDNIAVSGALTYAENFEGALNPHVQLLNTGPTAPFGSWARLYPHPTDNEVCTENTTCAWIWTDPTLPASYPDMAFGPGGNVVRPWIDNFIIGPWVPVTTPPPYTTTVMSYFVFGGQPYPAQSKIVSQITVDYKTLEDNTDTPAPGDSIECLHLGRLNNLISQNLFYWTTRFRDLTTRIPANATAIRVVFGQHDHQLEGTQPPATNNPGPGPYVDRIRIGRVTPSGPSFSLSITGDARTQAQDAFPTVLNGIVPGEHHSPSTDRFGTAAFSMSADIGNYTSANLVTGDSIVLLSVADSRGTGGIASVAWHGAIVAGPHAGKAPPPYTVGANGFFTIPLLSVPDPGTSAGPFAVDLDDTYFRGGDVLVYFWSATDFDGAFASMPRGLGSLPASVSEAETATGGLFEVSFLPAIDWDPGYLARVAADAHGDLDPTPAELSNSQQASCILYYQKSNPLRRTGSANRTAFMYTLDELGYGGLYDVYDVSGYGNTNNQLAGRATIEQVSGYSLIIQDDGRSSLTPNMPDGSDPVEQKLDQAGWYRDYLAQGATGLAGRAALWILGESTAIEKPSNALFTDMGLSNVVQSQALAVSPDVAGIAPFSWAAGGTHDFTGERFRLNGGCPSLRAYDGASASGTAVVTHRYESGANTGPGAVIMNSNAAVHWNTVWMGFGWFDIVDEEGGAPEDSDGQLAGAILSGLLPAGCAATPTDVPQGTANDAPRVSALHPNVPNPFNPTTTLSFDLAHAVRVRLVIYDVGGRRVRTLVDEDRPAGRNQRVVWNGADDSGRFVASGVYVTRLETDGFEAARRIVLLR